jgi:hypothetical protein
VIVNPQEFQDLLAAIDKSLAFFDEKPPGPGFDHEVYDELRRARETLIRAQRDLRDKNIPRDSRSPLESS